MTNVGFDHPEYAGPTLADVATEKAGIVKPGSTLVLGETDPELAAIFRAAGAARGRSSAARLRLCWRTSSPSGVGC